MPRQERRAQLLESALEVFVAQGYHAAAMDDIAERAGVSKPVLYQHFPGKLDLYLALLDASCDTIIDNCREALASTHDNKLRVAATMDVFYEYVAGDTGAFRLVFESDLTNEPAVREHVDRVTTECAAMIAAGDPRGHRPARRRRPGCWPCPWWEWPRSARGSGCPRLRHQARHAGRRRRPGRRPGLARHPRLPPDRRALTRRLEGEDPWRSRSASSTPPASSCVETNESVADIEKQVADAVTDERRPRPRPTRKGRKVLVPGDKIAYVEIGGGVAGQVGFRS